MSNMYLHIYLCLNNVIYVYMYATLTTTKLFTFPLKCILIWLWVHTINYETLSQDIIRCNNKK